MKPYTEPQWSDEDTFYCENPTAAVADIHYHEYLLRSVLEDGLTSELIAIIKVALAR